MQSQASDVEAEARVTSVLGCAPSLPIGHAAVEQAMASEREKVMDRIAALRAKTILNGCTEEEALSAAAKVAELLDRHALSMSDVEMRASPCERLVFETRRNKRIPLDACVAAIAHFCDCMVWREKDPAGAISFVFYGMPEDIAAARDLALGYV